MIVKYNTGGSGALTLGGAVLAVILVLSGCAGADDAAPLPDSSTNASPSTATTARPSRLPTPTADAPALTEEAFVSTERSILITFGGTIVRGSLQDNAASA